MSDRDRNLLAFVMSSRVGTAAERLRVTLAAALDASATGAVGRRWREAWAGSALGERRAFIGVVLIAASLTHVLLEIVAGNMVGPFWLIVPIVASCVGALCVVAGGGRSARE